MVEEILTQETTETDSIVITEYEQTVLQRLENIDTVLHHQYALGLFATGCITAVFVCVLLYKFLLRAFY